MERVGNFIAICKGGKIGYYSGNILKLIEDFQALKPTTIVGAPRVYQRIYDRVISTIENQSPLRRWLFWKAYNAKKRALFSGNSAPFWDKLIFSKIHEKIFGGRVSVFVSGSAPLSTKVHEFLRICFARQVNEAYGLTETCGCCSIQLLDEMRCGTVGPPHPAVLKLLFKFLKNFNSFYLKRLKLN